MAHTSAIRLLQGWLDEGFDARAWHGPTLRGSIRGVSAAHAARRPAAGRHNIWEIVVHCAYWKYAVRRRLTGDRRGSFALEGSNWFVRPERRRGSLDAAWRADVRLLIDEHRKLLAAVARLTPARLSARQRGSVHSALGLVRGIAAHDFYHAGQVQLLKRLVR